MNTEITDRNGATLPPLSRPQHRRHPSRFLFLFPFILLPASLLYPYPSPPPWAIMWFIAVVLFVIAKALTWRQASQMGATPRHINALGYFLAWPGMDPRPFLGNSQRPQPVIRKPRAAEWGAAASKAVLGVLITQVSAHLVGRVNPLLAGWMGMVGVVLFLHFGVFQLLALIWRATGREVQPLMNRPLRATSVAEFWGARWNTAFSQLVYDLVFRPIARRSGSSAGATMAVFLFSGLLHEAVISLPARGGYGLPTAYFTFQGVMVLAERTRWFRKLRFRAGIRWVLMVVCVGGPAFWLFHPPFVLGVMLPMLRAMSLY